MKLIHYHKLPFDGSKLLKIASSYEQRLPCNQNKIKTILDSEQCFLAGWARIDSDVEMAPSIEFILEESGLTEAQCMRRRSVCDLKFDANKR
jgi:hypothetical protein